LIIARQHAVRVIALSDLEKVKKNPSVRLSARLFVRRSNVGIVSCRHTLMASGSASF